MDTILWQVVKKFNLIRVLKNWTMEIFSMVVKNETKHKLAEIKVCETDQSNRMCFG